MKKLQTVFAVAYQDSSSGAVDWFNGNDRKAKADEHFKEVCADEDYASKDVVLFWFTVPADASAEAITETADDYMANMPAYSDAKAIAKALRAAGFDGQQDFAILELRAVDPFADSFMRPYIEHGDYFKVNTSAGTEIVPCDVIGRTMNVHVDALLNYLEGTPDDPEELCEVQTGWLARMSAPGYMDCTDWSAHASEDDARAFLLDTYGE